MECKRRVVALTLAVTCDGLRVKLKLSPPATALLSADDRRVIWPQRSAL